MKICSFTVKESNAECLGVFSPGKNEIADLTELNPLAFGSFRSMVDGAAKLGMSLDAFAKSEVDTSKSVLKKYSMDGVSFRIPFVPSEVWAAGVTYFRSRQAREDETSSKGLYDYVYNAKRPEIFFKTTGSRCVGPGEDVGIRGDSEWSVPEPELSVVLGHSCEVIGYTIGNDMSSRDIEGENPLYLPQAKIFRNCCALGPVVATREEFADPSNLRIDAEILRGSKQVFHGTVSTSQLKRSIEELVTFLKSNNDIPSCSVLMTGTGIVPPDDFSLADGDVIKIEIEGIGELRNTARTLR